MKRFLARLVVIVSGVLIGPLLFCLVYVCVNGCSPIVEQAAEKDVKVAKSFGNGGVYAYVIELDGHQYAVVDTTNGAGIVHAASCPCREKAGVNGR